MKERARRRQTVYPVAFVAERGLLPRDAARDLRPRVAGRGDERPHGGALSERYDQRFRSTSNKETTTRYSCLALSLGRA